MGARNLVGIGLSYRPARLHACAGGNDSFESILGLLKSLKIRPLNSKSFQRYRQRRQRNLGGGGGRGGAKKQERACLVSTQACAHDSPIMHNKAHATAWVVAGCGLYRPRQAVQAQKRPKDRGMQVPGYWQDYVLSESQRCFFQRHKETISRDL